MSKRKANLHKWLNKIIILLLLFSRKKVKIFFYRHGTRKRHFKIHRHNNNFSDISTDLKGALKASDDKGSISCKSSGSSYLRIGSEGSGFDQVFLFRHPKLGFWVLEFQIGHDSWIESIIITFPTNLSHIWGGIICNSIGN